MFLNYKMVVSKLNSEQGDIEVNHYQPQDW
jgi:hypothetical protein